MNSNAYFLQEGSNQGTHCFTKCKKSDDGNKRPPCTARDADTERYLWERLQKTNTKQCKYPHCKIQCNKYFCICQSISFCLVEREKLQLVEGTMIIKQEISCLLKTFMVTVIVLRDQHSAAS